jgi:lysophospholipase L1-like esterase
MSVSLVTGNICPDGFTYISSWEACRAALSVYSALSTNNRDVDGLDYVGTFATEDHPKGCINDYDGVWFNEAGVGSENNDAEVFCGDAFFESTIVQSGQTETTLLFVGDSDVDYWEQVESTFGTVFPTTNTNTCDSNSDSSCTFAYNVGYGGYTCKDVMDEASDFIGAFNPSKVVLVCGENDIAGGSSAAKAFARYQKVVLSYLDGGAIPVFSFSTKPEPDSTELHDKYKDLDRLIKDWAATLDGKLVFIDSYGGFEDLGNGVDLYDTDLLHLSELGYQYWEQWLTIALKDLTNCQVWRSGVCVNVPVKSRVKKSSKKSSKKDSKKGSKKGSKKSKKIGKKR